MNAVFKYYWKDPLVFMFREKLSFLGNNFIISLLLVPALAGIWEIMDSETEENFYRDVDV